VFLVGVTYKHECVLLVGVGVHVRQQRRVCPGQGYSG